MVDRLLKERALGGRPLTAAFFCWILSFAKAQRLTNPQAVVLTLAHHPRAPRHITKPGPVALDALLKWSHTTGMLDHGTTPVLADHSR